MPQYGTKNIRNAVLLSHSGAGKTSLAEVMLFSAGVINRIGKVDDGTTTSDFEPEEVKRQISLNLSILPFPWKEIKFNILDAPGYADFVGEVQAGIRVSEGAIITICAATGIEVGTEQVWSYCEEANLPRFVFLNKMDRENADFHRVVQSVQAKLSSRCLPVQLPIGSQSSFEGVIDLLSMKAYMGSQATEAEPPAAMQEQVKSFREKLVEAIAEKDDKLIEKYLNGEELSREELTSGLREAIKSARIIPVLAGSALKSIGVTTLMNAIAEYLPSPDEGQILVLDSSGNAEVSPTRPNEDAPLSALVFKTSADPYVGKLSYLRVYSGVLSSNSQILNFQQKDPEHIGQLFVMRGKTQEPVVELRAGDIGAVAKLSMTNTGDTLCAKDNQIRIAPVVFPKPIFSAAVYPKTKADLDKLGHALSRMAEEDPTILVRRDADTGETVISGMGETHLEVAVDRMARKFGIGVELKTPKVPYRETITVPVGRAEYKHKKQTGGHGQYGHVILELEPLPRGSGTEFTERVVGGSVPRNYIPAVEKGVNEAVKEGTLAGYPVVDVRATLYDGSFHPVDSSEICFKIAGSQAVKKGMAEGHPILIEPIMNLRVTVPEEFTGDIIGDLNTKRGRVSGMVPSDGKNVIEAQVPMSEIMRYTIDLKSITQGRATYTVEFSHYEEVPAHITQKIIAERQAEKQAEKD